MSALSQRPPATKASPITQSIFLGAIWAGVGVSFCFVGLRLYIRVRKYKRIFWDDGLVILSWLLSFGTAVAWQVVSGHMFQFLGVTSGRVWPAPPDMVPDTESYYKGSMAATIFFYLGLWSVKAAFLVFFKRLISDIRSLTIHWWVVTVFTFLCLVACFADTNYWCRLAPLSEIVKKCSGGPEIEKVLVVLKLNTAFDVITDFLIMSIPFTILWHVRVQAKKKLALLGLFSLVMITALFAILRAALVTKYSRQPEPSWLYIWTAVEHSMAVIVACLGTFRGLFVHEDKPLIGPAYSVREYSRKLFARNKPKHPLEESISMDDSILFPPQTRSISTGNSHEPFGLVDSTQKQSNFVHKPIEMPKRTGQVKS